jgi:hypothetical protein
VAAPLGPVSERLSGNNIGINVFPAKPFVSRETDILMLETSGSMASRASAASYGAGINQQSSLRSLRFTPMRAPRCTHAGLIPSQVPKRCSTVPSGLAHSTSWPEPLTRSGLAGLPLHVGATQRERPWGPRMSAAGGSVGTYRAMLLASRGNWEMIRLAPRSRIRAWSAR